MQKYPKVASVEAIDDLRLLVTFHNKTQKIYDCTALLSNKAFLPLKDSFLFKMVKTDQGGYGISWNDEIDVSESELWINGNLVEQSFPADGSRRR